MFCVLIIGVIVLLPCTFQYSKLCTENEDLYCMQLMTEQMRKCVYIPLHVSFQDTGETKLQQFSVLIHMNCYDLDLTSVPKVTCQVPSHHSVVELGCVGTFIGGIRFENIWTWPWSGYRTRGISVSVSLCLSACVLLPIFPFWPPGYEHSPPTRSNCRDALSVVLHTTEPVNGVLWDHEPKLTFPRFKWLLSGVLPQWQ